MKIRAKIKKLPMDISDEYRMLEHKTVTLTPSGEHLFPWKMTLANGEMLWFGDHEIEIIKNRYIRSGGNI